MSGGTRFSQSWRGFQRAADHHVPDESARSCNRFRPEFGMGFLPRLHLFELEDLDWFPHVIRNLATDYLQFIETTFKLHQPVAPLLRRALERSAMTQVLDLCSGGGGPIVDLFQMLAAAGMNARFTLTDKYPNLPAFRRVAALHPSEVTFISEPIDARAVPPELTGLRTVFNSFHHFRPEDGRAVLRCAVQAGQPIAVFEIPERSLVTTILLLLTPLYVALATPFMRPFRWSRLFWTYVLPLVPFVCWWDGLVSQLRAYTVPELTCLARSVGGTDYEWEVGRVGIGVTPGHVTYLIGLRSGNNCR